jgi:FtsH-binding integral membrane protein
MKKNSAGAQGRFAGIGKQAVAYDVGLRTYMMKVFGVFTSGLIFSAIVSLLSYEWYSRLIMANSIGLYAPMILWLLVSIGFNGAIGRISVTAARVWFYVDVGLLGLVISPMCIIYTPLSLASTFFVASSMFLAMIIYGYTTEKSLIGFGPVICAGFIGLIVAGIVNIFLRNSMFGFVISAIGVVVVTAYIAYITQVVRGFYSASDSRDVYDKKVMVGASALYHGFMNLFLRLLHLLGNRR